MLSADIASMLLADEGYLHGDGIRPGSDFSLFLSYSESSTVP
jgi:hypothetical protein